MKRIHLLVALAGLALALRSPPRVQNALTTSTCRTAGSPKGSRSGRPTLLRRLDPDRPCLEGQSPHRPGRGARPRPRAAAIGVELDHRNRLWVAGGPTGDGYVYNASTGADIAQFNFTDATSFVNDVVVTKRAAWFTDSMRQFLYKVPIARTVSSARRRQSRSPATSSTSPAST